MIKDGSWRPGSGGLGEVLPGSLGKLLVQAAGTADGQALYWIGKSKTRHVFRVCAAPSVIEWPAPTMRAGIDSHGQAPEDRFEPLADQDQIERLAVTALVAGERAPQTSRVAPPLPALFSGDAGATLAGRLVHRLLQFHGHSNEVEADDLVQIARALVRPEELSSVEDLSGTLAEAVRMYKAIRSQNEFSVLASDECLFEVPFSFRGAGASTILRGTIDCLTKHPDGRMTVFEFKTGRPTADHRAQLDIYLAAVRTLFPGVPVEGRLIYP
jgi:ATP-dependent exoDNAse (exonuclease V) beta subunit